MNVWLSIQMFGSLVAETRETHGRVVRILDIVGKSRDYMIDPCLHIQFLRMVFFPHA